MIACQRTKTGLSPRMASRLPPLTAVLPVGRLVRWIAKFMMEIVRNPASIRTKWEYTKKVVMDELHHYGIGERTKSRPSAR
jgi:hypothetical protein